MAYIIGRSDSFEVSGSPFSGRVTWSETYDIVANKSIVSIDKIEVKSSNWYGVGYYPSGSISIDGTKVGSASSGAGTHYVTISKQHTYYAIEESGERPFVPWVSGEIAHSADGTRSIVISVNIGLYTISGKYGSGNKFTGEVTVELTHIPRAAILTTAPDFTDEDNPTITLSNPAGTVVDELAACISLEGEFDDISYRVIPDKTATSYTFELTDQEREALQLATLSGSSTRSVFFVLRTNINGTLYYNKLERTLSIVNAKPVMSVQFEDVNSTTVAITKNNTIFVKDYSDMLYRINAETFKGAIVEKYEARCGSVYSTQATNVLLGIDSDTIVFSVTDSRGLTSEVQKLIQLVPYVSPTCVIQLGLNLIENTVAEAEVTVTGRVYSGNFGETSNTVIVEANYTGSDGWVDVTSEGALSVSNNAYSFNFVIPNLDYRNAFSIQCRVTDLLDTALSGTESKSILPAFYWGKDSFFFNVAVGMLSRIILSILEDDSLVLSNAAPILLRPGGSRNSRGQLQLTEDKASFYGPVDFQNKKVLGIPEPINKTDAANKSYVDDAIKSAVNNISPGAVPESVNVEANVAVPVSIEEGELYHICFLLNGDSGTGDIFLKANEKSATYSAYTFAESDENFTDGQISYAGSGLASVFTATAQVHNGQLIVSGKDIRGNGTGTGNSLLVWNDMSSVSSLTFSRSGSLMLIGAGTKGEKGDPGKDGVTPVKGVDYFDGEPGIPGANGVSPTVAVSEVTGGHRVSITDATGTKTVDVMDGKTGATGPRGETGPAGPRGEQGEVGTSPTVSVSYITGGHRIVITDVKGSKTVDVMDGKGGTGGRIVTHEEMHWMEGWQAPNNANGTSDPGVNLQNNHSRRMATLPFWLPEGTVLARNDKFYTAIDADGTDSDGYPVRIMLSHYDQDSESANPMGWVQILYSEIEDTPSITIGASGWYILSITHGTANSATKSFGHPYTFAYALAEGYEPNYVMCVDWKTYYNVRGAGVSQPGFSNGLNWACRREPGCPYYLDNKGYGSEYNRGGYKTTNLTLASKKSSSVAGIMSYKDEIWTFFTSDDDHSTLGSVTKYRICDNHWIEYLGRCWINAGHINSVHYDPDSDTMIWGNGSTSYTLEGEGYILNRFSESVLANAYNDEICLMDEMGVDVASLPIATYGVKANVIGIGCDYYEGNTMSLIVALLTNDGNTLRLGHIKGTEEAKPQYLWENCTWLDAMTIGDADETIGPGSTESYVHCVQDMTVWQGQLLWGEGHGENRYALWKHTPTESVRVSNLMQTMPNSNVHAVTEHHGKLFGAGLNMFCMIDPKAGIEFVYGAMPSVGVADSPGGGGGGGGDVTVNYAVSYNLTKCTSNNSTTIVAEGSSFSATLTPTSGYELTGIMVTMGGTDITGTVVSGGTINIASVTGNIVITAVATEAAKANLWDLTERTEYTKAELGLSTSINSIAGTAARTIRYDKYLRGATINGNWNFNASQQPILTIDGENAFTIKLLQGGNGLGMPMDLKVGKTYKITYTADNTHRLYATYFNESGVYAYRDGLGGVTGDVAAGTYSRTLTVSNYAYCQLTITATANVTTSFSNIVIEEA